MKMCIIANRIITVVFSLFILFTIALFVSGSPIADGLLSRGNRVWWYVFILLVFAAVFIVVLIKDSVLCKLNKGAFDLKRSMILLIIVTAVPRVIWTSMVNVVPQSDFGLYHLLASEYARGNITGHTYISQFPHVIGYPAVLSVIYRMFSSSVTIAQVFNILLGCQIAILIYLIGRKLNGDKCGLICAILWALWPSQIFYNSLVATEELYTFLMLIFILAFIYVLDKKRNIQSSVLLFLFLGVLCGIINSIRPLGILLLVAVAIYYFIFSKEQNIITKKVVVAKTMLYIFFAGTYFMTTALTSYTISSVLDRKISTSPIGFNAYVGSNIKYSGRWNSEDSKVLNDLTMTMMYNPQQIHDKLLTMALERFSQQGMQNFSLFVEKHKIMWGTDDDILWYIKSALDKETPSRFDFNRYYNVLDAGCNFYYYVVLIFCSVGGITAFKRSDNSYILFLLLIVLGMFAVHTIMEVAGRYHYPAISIFSLTAGYGLRFMKMTHRVRRDNSKEHMHSYFMYKYYIPIE